MDLTFDVDKLLNNTLFFLRSISFVIQHNNMRAARNLYLALNLTARTVIDRKVKKYVDRPLNKDRQCTYKIILRRFRVNIFAVENYKYYTL